METRNVLRRLLGAAVAVAAALCVQAPYMAYASSDCTIATYDELVAFAEAVDGGDTYEGSTVTLGSDITITGDWNPIGSWTGNDPLTNGKPFRGEFDGAGHTITFAANDATQQYYGLFAATFTGAYIHDLVIDGSITSTQTTVGAVVGQMAGSTKLERVGNEADISSTGASSATIQNSVGGLVGAANKPTDYEAQTFEFVQCYNKGSIQGTGARIGGILGNSTDGATFTSCYNTGDVKMVGTTNSTSSNVNLNIGGIFGGNASRAARLVNCYDTGVVSHPNVTNSVMSGALVGSEDTSNPSGNKVCYYLEGTNERARGGTNAQPKGFIVKTAANFADESTDEGVLALLNVGDYESVWAAGTTLKSTQASPGFAWEVAYDVAFVDDDGSTALKDTERYRVGTAASDIALPDDPVKAATDEYTYSFAGWQPALAEVTADVTYTATYSAVKNKYDVVFMDGEEQLGAAQSVEYGSAATAPADPSKEGYVFEGWDADFSNITGNLTVNAQWSVAEYTVTWLDEDGAELAQATVQHGDVPAYDGDEPVKEADAQYTYTFASWSPEPVAATADASYTATYDAALNSYTVTFANEDGSVLQTSKQAYGAMPAYTGDEPTKAETDTATYSFSGWTPEIAAVTGDATYIAMFAETAKQAEDDTQAEGGDEGDSSGTDASGDSGSSSDDNSSTDTSGDSGSSSGAATDDDSGSSTGTDTGGDSGSSSGDTPAADAGETSGGSGAAQEGASQTPADPAGAPDSQGGQPKPGDAADPGRADAPPAPPAGDGQGQAPAPDNANSGSGDTGQATADNTAKAAASVARTQLLYNAPKVGKRSIKLSWDAVKDAKKYVVYASPCGLYSDLVKVKTTKKTAFTLKKIDGERLQKGTYYKIRVVALDSKGKVLSTVRVIHVVTKGGKYANAKSVETAAKKGKVTLKAGERFRLAARPVSESDTLVMKRHSAIKYTTSDKSVAVVSAAGKIRAKAKGTCYVYAVAQNGVYAKVKVKVTA